ncbi:MAG: hypothetical protein IGS48_04605 [Oscillatoriales cyanobacterium C42_A2020_001]|nr:hypothetical protein [Leptolyngbyaceae cyanobacterium C42_A2020_001]
MQSQKNQPRSNWSKLANRINIAAMGVVLSVGAVALSGLPASANPKAPSANASSTVSLPDGVYLYGQSTQPNEIGKGYFVFESKKGQVVGALYMPHSSFDCAEGSFKNDQLALTVTNSYDRAANPFEIAIDRTSTVASSGDPSLKVGLQGFHKLDAVTENDQRMLNTCKADLQGQAKASK